MQLDLFGARGERDKALDRVLGHTGPWIGMALAHVLLVIPRGVPHTGEEIRLLLTREGLPPPHHHNAWGAMMRVAIRRGIIREVGMGQMATKKSHARRTPLYVCNAPCA